MERQGKTFRELKERFTKESVLVSRSLMVDFILFFLFIFILLYFSFSFKFLFLEQLRLGLSVTLSHQSQLDGVVMRLITGEVEGTRTK